MGYRVFAYIGSYRRDKSITTKVVQSLLSTLANDYRLSFDKVTYSADACNIKDCLGCQECFMTGKCPVVDDMETIKQDILRSDLLVLASPVFFHHISGDTKRLIDRLSYWAHILRLIGKLSVPVAVEDTNGAQFAVDYLEKFLLYTGTSVLTKVVVSGGRINSEEAFNSVIKYYASQIYRNMKTPPFAASQSQYYQQMKRIMMLKHDNSIEKQYWTTNDLFQFNSFEDLFYSAFLPCN